MRVPLIDEGYPPYIDTQRHHVYGGSRRKWSEKYKCVAYLPLEEHTGTNGVHRNKAKRLALQETFQRKLEAAGWTRAEFRETFGKSYL